MSEVEFIPAGCRRPASARSRMLLAMGTETCSIFPVAKRAAR